MDIEREIKIVAPDFARKIRKAADDSRNEAEFRSRIYQLIENFATQAKLPIYLREEYTLINGRADAVYNRLIIEYESPGILRKDNYYRANQHSIEQVKRYMEGLSRRERHRAERLVGVILDGYYFIFVRRSEKVWHIDPSLKVDTYTTEYFLKLLASLSTELALIPKNLIRDFGENSSVARKIVSVLYSSLNQTQVPRVKALFEQWSLQFSEVCNYEEASKLKIEPFAKRFAIQSSNVQPFPFFFSLHTYYAVFIKLLALQIVQYYRLPKLEFNLKEIATFEIKELKNFLKDLEQGAIFRRLQITNFLEGDFFDWYLDIWSESVYHSFKDLISTLANYSLLTLDIDPDTTRDLLKKLYQELMPKQLRHNLGEYYTPDWLAERLLNMLGFKGDPDERLLDPGCGSGTFLVIAIKRIRKYANGKNLPKAKLLEKILSNIVGFDLNPLAVISARTNYLLALGDLLEERREDIIIPIYICDSILTPQEGEELETVGTARFNTAVGPFSLPRSLIQAKYIDTLSNFLEEAVKLGVDRDQFIEKLCQRLPLIPEEDRKDIDMIYKVYDKLMSLEKQGINGKWARITKNAFAPLFVGRFDYVAGNPPWVNWESLPENYRKELIPLWSMKYGLFPHRGFEAILGKAKDDISILMTYVSLDKYLKKNGRLGFLITQSVFKTSGAGQGFRKFRLPNGKPIQVLYVDDMTELKPFEGVGNRTSIVILLKGRPTKYPVPYNYWVKRVKGKGIKDNLRLKEVTEIATYKKFYAEPVDEDDSTSSWITGRARALKAVKKIIGKSDYAAHEGVNTGGANGVYWVEIVGERPDGLIVISNITKGAKRKVEGLQAVIEKDLLYPLLRGRDVKRWRAKPSAHILITHLPGMRLNAIPEEEMKTQYPKTYLYLKRFEKALRERAALKRYFAKKERNGRTIETGPFYSMFDVGDYTFAPYKVVWPNIASEIVSAVISIKGEKPILPQHIITIVACSSQKEAHYICALMNSKVVNFALQSYSQKGGKSFGDPHVLQNIRIPEFNPQDKVHLQLVEFSEKAHELAKKNDEGNLKEVEREIDELSAQIWKLTREELKDIRLSLEELI